MSPPKYTGAKPAGAKSAGAKPAGPKPAKPKPKDAETTARRLACLHAYWYASMRVHERIKDNTLGFETAARHLVSAARDPKWDKLRCAAGATVASRGLNVRGHWLKPGDDHVNGGGA